MKFLEDIMTNHRHDRIGITSLISTITTREGSHKGGWARLLRCQLTNMGYNNTKILDKSDKLSDFDVIIYDLGAEYSGTLNMFGGLDEKVYGRLKEIQSFRGNAFSWKHQLPDLLETFKTRANNSSTCDAYKQEPVSFLHSVSEALQKVEVFQHAYRTRGLLIGDSHTPSVWTPEFMIERRDGRTLKGMLDNDTIDKYLKVLIGDGCDINKIQIHCSSIDVRHHICRESDPEQYAYELACQLLNKVHKLPLQVILTQTMGIEDESRDLPKTGYFKGTPFAGSWEERNSIRDYFNSKLDEMAFMNKQFMSVVKFPEYFFENKKLKFEVMEKPGSVHLSPEHYRWNLDENILRWKNES